MASIKAVLRKKKNKEGKFPIVIRITKDRKTSFLYTGQYVSKREWDEKNHKVKKSHPNSTRLNNLILKKLSEANEKLLELEANKERSTAKNVTEKIKGKQNQFSVYDEADLYLKELEEGKKYTRWSADKSRVKVFKEFMREKPIRFEDLTPELLKKFKFYLLNVQEISERTAQNYLVVIRTIFNRAIRKGIVDKKHYPFGKGKITIRFPQTTKRGLSAKRVKALEEINLKGKPKQIHARNIWLFSFYFAGMRIGDVLKIKWSDFKDGRLYYQMSKNQKVLSLKVPRKIKPILKQYQKPKPKKEDFVFPELKAVDLENERQVYRAITGNTKTINKYLGEIAEALKFDIPLTMHISRHSFAALSGDKIPIQMLQQLYRHSDIQTTINYQKAFIYKDADEALDKVLDF